MVGDWWQGAPFTRRIFVTCGGWRQTEPASLTAVATHHCLSNLLMYIANKMLDASLPEVNTGTPGLPASCQLVFA